MQNQATASTLAVPTRARAAHDLMANAIRALAMDAVEAAKSGHPGLPMGAADIATVLFTRFLKFDPSDPAWSDRDRFVLSAGHGSMLIYALLHLLGYEAVTIEEIKRFRQLGSKTPGHPENFVTPGVETTTGPLGQGLANAVGMAIAEAHLAAEFGRELVDHRTYVLASDGDLMEGISQEAIALAGHLRLNKLIVLFDDNGISIDGPLSLADSVDQVKRFEAAGWAAVRIDGHDPEAIADRDRTRAAIRPSESDRLPHHHRFRRADQSRYREMSRLAARHRRNCRDARRPGLVACAVRDPSRNAKRMACGRPALARRYRAAWDKRVDTLAADRRAEFDAPLCAVSSPQTSSPRRSRPSSRSIVAVPKEIATRAASELALEVLDPGASGNDRRIRRPHRLQQHQAERHDGIFRQ